MTSKIVELDGDKYLKYSLGERTESGDTYYGGNKSLRSVWRRNIDPDNVKEAFKQMREEVVEGAPSPKSNRTLK